jgi:hypothetical protein
MDLDPNAPAQVYYLSGNDHEDDPAWGMSPVQTGSLRQIAYWLMAQDSLEGLSVVIGHRETIWARDLLSRLISGL